MSSDIGFVRKGNSMPIIASFGLQPVLAHLQRIVRSSVSYSIMYLYILILLNKSVEQLRCKLTRLGIIYEQCVVKCIKVHWHFH